jgi:hypothetical protein
MAEPITLLDLDAAGLDPRQPAPPEFIQFLYDNSRSGYLTLWSSQLYEPDFVSHVNRWIQDGLHVYYSRSLLTQVAAPGPKPSGSDVTEVTYTGPTTMPAPVCVSTPYVSGSPSAGSVLTCTMGNWGNLPESYVYQWQSDGAAVGDGSNTYLVDPTDSGKTVNCVVTATNAGGSTVAPPSNGVQIE